MKGHYFRDEQGFTYVFPDNEPGTMCIGCSGKPWRKLSVGDRAFDCGTLTSEMYTRLRSECIGYGTFEP